MASIKTDQIIFPIDQIKAKVKIHGLYAIPQQWKTTDESNPGLFTYSVRMSKFEILKGKVCPRELTEKQKRQLEEKNKKGGKKDSKNPEPNEQEERIRKQQEERQRQRQELFAKLSQEQQFYHTAQDIYRAPFLKFWQPQSSYNFKGSDCLVFQQRLTKDKGDWVYVYKHPIVSEDELAKMRKNKPKTLNNISDLNPVVMRAWVSFQDLTVSAKTQIKQIRCKLTQVDKTPQTSQPNLQKTYIKLTLSLQQPILQQKDALTSSSLIPDPAKPPVIPPEQQSLSQLNQELSLAIESLAMEYSTMFWKELNMQQEQKLNSVFLNNKKNELTKRKEQFLYDFNVTGKYKILKDRVKKCIVHLCQTKYKSTFQGMKSFNGIKCSPMDQMYSQIYNLLVNSYQSTFLTITTLKSQSLHQVLVPNNTTNRQQKQTLLTSYHQQTIIQRAKRTLKQYETLQMFNYGQQLLKKYMGEYPEVVELKYLYGTYCLKYNLRTAREVLPFILEFLTKQKNTLPEDKRVEFMMLMFNVGGQSYPKGWLLLRELLENQLNAPKPSQNLSLWLLLASVVLKQMDMTELSIKYRAFALREAKKSAEGLDASGGSHKDGPKKGELPTLGAVAAYGDAGSSDDLNKLFDGLVEYLNKFAAFELIKKVIAQKQSTQPKKPQQSSQQVTLQKSLPLINQLLVSYTSQSLNQLIQLLTTLQPSVSTPQQKFLLNQLLQKAYLLKANSLTQQTPQSLTILKTLLQKSLQTNTDKLNRFLTLLRLGYVYGLMKEFGNARACLLKYLEMAKDFPQYLSGLAYKLLGVACLRLDRVDDAVQNFKHWNLSDTKAKAAWLYLALAFARQGKLVIVNQCLAQFKKRVQQESQSQEQGQVLAQIGQLLSQKQPQGQYQSVIKGRILEALA